MNTECPSTHGDQTEDRRTRSCTANFTRSLLLPFLCVLRGIFERGFGTHQALPEDHEVGVAVVTICLELGLGSMGSRFGFGTKTTVKFQQNQSLFPELFEHLEYI